MQSKNNNLNTTNDSLLNSDEIELHISQINSIKNDIIISMPAYYKNEFETYPI